MRNRIITVPKDKGAENALNYNEAKDEQLIEIILTETEYLILYDNKVFDLINQEGHANIDDFEEESITEKESIEKVIKALEKRSSLTFDSSSSLINDIIRLFKEALNRDTSVHFYF